MTTLLIALGAGIAFIIAYHTYGRWLGRRIFRLSASAVCPSTRLNDGTDYVPTAKPIVFGHHFTSIAGTGPIVGPAIAVMWGWVPALLWVVLGSIFIGAVHDFGALVVSLRNNGQTVGDIAGRVLNRRVRLLFLFVLFLALTIVLAIFGLVIAAVFRQYPAAIFPCTIQIPIAIVIGFYLHRKGVSLTLPSLIALAIMYVTVVFGNVGFLGAINSWMASWPTMVWVIVLLVYSYVASVLPVWVLLQPRDYINSLQLLTALGLIVVGLGAAAFIGGAPPVEGAERPALDIVAPAIDFNPKEAPVIFPFLFITIACGAISGFHCLVSSGTSSKQLKNETDAQFVGYGSMLTEGFLATLVILACVAGLGLGIGSELRISNLRYDSHATDAGPSAIAIDGVNATRRGDLWEVKGMLLHATPSELEHLEIAPVVSVDAAGLDPAITYTAPGSRIGVTAWNSRYESWGAAGSLGRKVGAFVDGAANFLKAIGIPGGIAIALMGVLVASFAGTTLDTACRLQRYVVQELAATFAPVVSRTACAACGYDLSFNVSGTCPECGGEIARASKPRISSAALQWWDPLVWLTNKHGATIVAVVIGMFVAALPPPGTEWTWQSSGTGGLILWPMFGATNQLLGGLSFLVIAFYLWRRKKPIWFLIFPLIFMLIMPAWAMLLQLPDWLRADVPNWPLVFIAVATLLLEAWMIVEAVLLFPKVKGLLEDGAEKMDHTVTALASSDGPVC